MSDRTSEQWSERDPVPLFEIAWDERDIRNVVESVSRGGYWAKGPFVDEFEERLAEYLGVDHAITVNSGTTALVAALRAHGVGPGDEVVLPSFTFIATANAVDFLGADPVFADIERETYGLDPDAVRDCLSPQTAAILPVHCYGASCDLDALADIAAEHGVPLVEDAAEALGASYGGEWVGTVGETAALSFCQNKIVATGEGGAVVTDDPDVAHEVRLFRSHGRTSDAYFESPASGEYSALGGNFRMPDIVAAIGCAQMEKIEELIEGRRTAAGRLNDALADVSEVDTPASPHGRHVYQLYTVTLAESVDRAALIEALADRGIASKVYWDPPVHRTGRFDGRATSLPVTEDIASRVLSLPIHPNVRVAESERITAAVRDGVASASQTAGRTQS